VNMVTVDPLDLLENLVQKVVQVNKDLQEGQEEADQERRVSRVSLASQAARVP